MPDCREKIIRELEGKLTIGEIEHIFDKIEKRFGATTIYPKELATDADIAAYKEKLKGMTSDQRWGKAVQDAFEEAVQDKKDALRREYLQAAKNDQVLAYITKNSEKGSVNGLIKLMVGDLRGTQQDVTLEGRMHGILQLDMADMYAAFDDYMGFMGGKFSEEQALNITREMDAPGSTGDKAAQKLVDAWTMVAGRNRNRKNELGANIGYLINWRLPQSWDAAETSKFGLSTQERLKLLNPAASKAEKDALYQKAHDRFVDEAMKRVDREKYLDQNGMPLEDEDLQGVLSEIWQTIRTGGLSAKPVLGGGKTGLAQSLGEHRELHFKSAEDWYAFNKDMGQFDILGIMQKSILKNAKDTALLEVFGPNPEIAFKNALAQAKHLDAGGMKPDKISSRALRAEYIFSELSGLDKDVGSQPVANFFTGLRQWMVASKLGSVLLSQVNDTATYAAIARTDGLGVGKAIEFAAKNLSHLNETDRKIANRLGIASQAMINDVAQRYGEASKGVSLPSKFANATIRLSGMKWWTDSMQRSYQMLIGFHMSDAIKAGQDFKTMDPHFARMLDRYGIREAEWNIIKQAKGADIMGNEMVTPVSIKMLGDTPEIRETALKVAAMMHEEANTAIVSPGARQYSWVNEKAPAGTKAGELIRSLALFHQFTFALTQKVFPRVFGVEGTAGFRAGVGAQFALSMILTGAISYQLKEIAKGRNPRDITEPKFWLSATMQSGGFGIFGDFLYSDVQKFGGGLMSTAGGPVLGLVDDFKKLTFDNIWAAARGEDTHIGAEAIQFVKNYTPYVNLWYSRAALDHLLFFTVQEAANPGYLRRMRSRAQRQNNQTFWWDPQDKLPEEAPDFKQMVGGR